MAGSFFRSSLWLLALSAVAGVTAQSSSAWTDPKTGIDFQAITNDNGFTFGIALPEKITTDFIGIISAQETEGWAGVSLQSRMQKALLIVAYPDGNGGVTSSLRQASAYASPDVFSGDAKLMPIPDGTFVNETSFSFTFLCQNCILDDGRTFTPTDDPAVLSWALSNTAVDTPSSADSILNYHENFGMFGCQIQNATSANFDKWAAEAEDPVNTPTPGNGTIPDAPVANQTFDYIVAGAGSAGIVAAERFAEAGKSVLLIERGPPSFFATGGRDTPEWNDTVTHYEVPGLASYLQDIPAAGANFCSDIPGQAGCLLGGGSAVNGMEFMRPPERDFDEKWPKGWKWDDMAAAADRLYARNGGQIVPSADGKLYDQAVFDIMSHFLSESGWTETNAKTHPNDKHMIYSHSPQNTINGLRAGPVRAYLPLAEELNNFKLMVNTKVLRAVRSNSTVTGVEVELEDGSRRTYNVNKGGKVILAAGAMSTPRILFNSGIGPTKQIEIAKNSSQLIHLPKQSEWIDLPVGKEIQDHIIMYIKWNITSPRFANKTTLSEEQLINPSTEMIEQFARGEGPLVQNKPRLEFWTDVTNDDGSVRYVQGTCSSSANGTVTSVLFLTHGLTSSGELGLKPNGATYFITEPWMNTPGDHETVEKFIGQMLDDSRRPGSILTSVSGSNATVQDVIRDSPWQSGIHFVGSAPMGLDDGRKGGRAVADTKAKVYGTDNLYVVDASLHADVPTANTMVITMIVAEKAAEVILAEDGLQIGGGSGSGGNGGNGGNGGSGCPSHHYPTRPSPHGGRPQHDGPGPRHV